MEAEGGGKSVQELGKALETEDDAVMQGTILRLLAQRGEEAVPLLRELAFGEKNPPSLRERAFLALWNARQGNLGEEVLLESLESRDLLVRRLAVQALLAWDNPPEALRLAGERLLKTEPDAQIRELLVKATWPFHRNVTLLKNRPDWDHEVIVAADHPLPEEEWAFRTDPKGNLHSLEKPFLPGYDDSAWKKIPIGKTWEAGGVDYDGIAWYRKTFQAPGKPSLCHAAELRFDSVDESAWVWLNGQYVGEHDIGPVGWNVPFSLDVTDLIRWGEPNQITVRVQDVGGAGGIYKSVRLQVME